MTLEEFKESIKHKKGPNQSLSLPLQALWHDAKGDWDFAHTICQNAHNSDGDWVHAYLHRKEGDLSNANYWYGRAGKPEFNGSLEEEWEAMLTTFLANKS